MLVLVYENICVVDWSRVRMTSVCLVLRAHNFCAFRLDTYWVVCGFLQLNHALQGERLRY